MAVLASVVTAAWAFGAESKQEKKLAPPPEDAIAAARRDLETIKAARSVTETPKAGLPSFATPEMQIAPPAPRRATAPLTAAEAAAAKKSANWLVEAMMKPPARAREDQRRGERREASSVSPDEDTTTDAVSGERTAASERNDVHLRRETAENSAAVVNPLNGFMAGWMTPQDFKLLQPGMMGESAAHRVARGDTSQRASDGAMAADLTGLAPFGRTGPTTMPPAPRENPFLAEFASPTPATPAARASVPSLAGGAPPSAHVSTARVTPPPVAPAPKPVMPAFVKPNDDAKYFKPLKKF